MTQLILIALLSSSVSFAFTGKAFVKGTTNHIFTYERSDVEKDGLITATATYKDKAGKVALKETTVYGKDLKFRTYTLQQNQLGYSGVVNYNKNKVSFDLTKNGKKKGTETEERDDPVLVGSMLSFFIRSNWKKLEEGKEVEFRLAVVDRQETIGFEFKKVKNREVAGKSYTTIKMSPSSWIISQVVDDIFFLYEGKDLKIYEGRLTVKQKKDGKWEDLDATVFYTP